MGGMQIVYDDQALADLEHIFNWIAQDQPRRCEDRG
jgi:plasmid stabilization system protein ParE